METDSALLVTEGLSKVTIANELPRYFTPDRVKNCMTSASPVVQICLQPGDPLLLIGTK
jgi:hypothetical protein